MTFNIVESYHHLSPLETVSFCCRDHCFFKSVFSELSKAINKWVPDKVISGLMDEELQITTGTANVGLQRNFYFSVGLF